MALGHCSSCVQPNPGLNPSFQVGRDIHDCVKSQEPLLKIATGVCKQVALNIHFTHSPRAEQALSATLPAAFCSEGSEARAQTFRNILQLDHVGKLLTSKKSFLQHYMLVEITGSVLTTKLSRGWGSKLSAHTGNSHS